MMMTGCVLLFALTAGAQKYITKTGFIRFYSDAPLEKIEAMNRQVFAAVDISSGEFAFKVLMKSFKFEKALMQEHFNDNYVESDKFPNAEFRGKISNPGSVNFGKDGTYNATVEGKLTIHGISRDVRHAGTVEVSSGKILAKSKFTILLSDYGIDIPAAVGRNISNTVEITVDVVLDKVE